MLSGTVVRLNDAQAKQASLRLSRGDIFEWIWNLEVNWLSGT
jgi:hypothetical protein